MQLLHPHFRNSNVKAVSGLQCNDKIHIVYLCISICIFILDFLSLLLIAVISEIEIYSL
jgi:hypothetical protein